MSHELDERLVEVLTAKRARLVEEVNASRRQREEIAEKMRRAEVLIAGYDVVLEAQRRPTLSAEQQRLGGGLVEVFQPTSGDIEIEVPDMEIPKQPTVAGAITALLVERNRALHADEIVEELLKRGMRLSPKDPKASVVTALVRGARKGIFEKVGPNRYEVLQTGVAGLRHPADRDMRP